MKRRRWGGERGSVLALVPAGFLVLILLGAIAVDSAVAYQAQEELHDALSAAANDAVAAAVDNHAFYSSGRVTLDPAAAAAAVCQSVAAQSQGPLHQLKLAMAVSGTSMRVDATASVDAVFGRIVPGFGTRTISSSADATLSNGGPDRPASFGPVVPISCP